MNHLDLMTVDGLGKAYVLAYAGRLIEESFCDEPDEVKDLIASIFAKADAVLEEVGL